MEYIIYILVVLVGLSVGSFLNVVIYRIPRKEKFMAIRSYCPHCKNNLKWYHNIPLLSYLFLLGKCGFCSKSIPVRYPLVELGNALIFAIFYYQYGLTFFSVIYALICSALIVVFFIDMEFMIIPDSITLPGIIIGLAVSFHPDGIGLVNALIGFAVGGGSLYLIAILGELLFKKESMGGGDIKMAAMLGAFLGWQKVLLIFISSAVIGLIISIAVMTYSAKVRKERMIPFGPFLAIAALLAIFYGDSIINYYITNFLQM